MLRLLNSYLTLSILLVFFGFHQSSLASSNPCLSNALKETVQSKVGFLQKLNLSRFRKSTPDAKPHKLANGIQEFDLSKRLLSELDKGKVNKIFKYINKLDPERRRTVVDSLSRLEDFDRLSLSAAASQFDLIYKDEFTGKEQLTTLFENLDLITKKPNIETFKRAEAEVNIENKLTAGSPGSSHTVYKDQSNSKRYLVKKHQDGREYRSYFDELAYNFSQRLGLKTTVPTYARKIGGNKTSVVEMVDGEIKDLWSITKQGSDYSQVSKEVARDLAREHVLDWVLSNHDAHGGNFLIDANGQLKAIDKSQAYKYAVDPENPNVSKPADQLNFFYNPNEVYNGKSVAYAPVYHQFFKQLSAGEIKNFTLEEAFTEAMKVVDKVEEIKPSLVRKLSEDLATQLDIDDFFPGDLPGDAIKTLISERIKNTRENFSQLYNALFEHQKYRDAIIKLKQADEFSGDIANALAIAIGKPSRDNYKFYEKLINATKGLDLAIIKSIIAEDKTLKGFLNLVQHADHESLPLILKNIDPKDKNYPEFLSSLQKYDPILSEDDYLANLVKLLPDTYEPILNRASKKLDEGKGIDTYSSFDELALLSTEDLARLTARRFNNETTRYNHRYIEDFIEQNKPSGVSDESAYRALYEMSEFASASSVNELMTSLRKIYKNSTFITPRDGTFVDALGYLNQKFTTNINFSGKFNSTGKNIIIVDEAMLEIIKDSKEFQKEIKRNDVELITIHGLDDNMNLANLSDTKHFKDRFLQLSKKHSKQASESANYPITNKITSELEKLGLGPKLQPKYYDSNTQALYDVPVDYSKTDPNLLSSDEIAFRLSPKRITSESILKQTANESEPRFAIIQSLTNGRFISFENMGESLSKQHNELMQRLQKSNVQDHEVAFYADYNLKSPQLLMWIYRKINDVPNAQMFSKHKVLDKDIDQMKVMVVLDDYVGTGDSIREFKKNALYEAAKMNPGLELTHMVIAANSGWRPKDWLQGSVGESVSSFKEHKMAKTLPKELQEQLAGNHRFRGGFGGNSNMVSFEYMSPDNNSTFWSQNGGFTSLFLRNPASAK